MDRFIAAFTSVEDADLRLCHANGVAYQADMKATARYDESYFAHYKGLEGTQIAARLNAGRCAMLARHAVAESSVLDIGAGCGTFVCCARSWGYNARGFDIIPETVEILKAMDAFAHGPAGFEVVTFWDSLEHIEEPESVLGRIELAAVVLVAIPVFADLTRIRESKHYKPGEHLYYFTDSGFAGWMALHGFKLLERSTHETDAGRESIGAYAFRRVRIPTAGCPCGGQTFVDSFDWPNKPRQWFLRCEKCHAMSDAVHTQEAACTLSITA